MALAAVLLSAASMTTGSSTTSSCPTLEMPSVVATRNSRTPSGASSATVTFSFTVREQRSRASAADSDDLGRDAGPLEERLVRAGEIHLAVDGDLGGRAALHRHGHGVRDHRVGGLGGQRRTRDNRTQRMKKTGGYSCCRNVLVAIRRVALLEAHWLTPGPLAEADFYLLARTSARQPLRHASAPATDLRLPQNRPHRGLHLMTADAPTTQADQLVAAGPRSLPA